MSYKGRFIAIGFTVCAALVFIGFYFSYHKQLELYHLIYILFILISWKLGAVLDKAKHLSEQTIKHAEYYQSFSEHHPDAIYELDRDGNFISGNNALASILGYTIEEILQSSFVVFIHPEDLDRSMMHFQKAIQGIPQIYEIRAIKKNGDMIWTEVKNFPITRNHKIEGVYSIAKDITEKKNAENELIETKQTLENTLHNQQGMTFKFVKKNGEYIHTLSEGKLMYNLGLRPEQVVGKTLFDFLDPSEAEAKLVNYDDAWEGKQSNYIGRVRNGDVMYYATLEPVFRNGQVVEVIGSCVDITERHRLEDELKYMAYHDSLTGLYNRRKFEEVIHSTVEESIARKQKMALLFFDMDRFKIINDTLGHDAGDLFLKEISKRLISVADEKDMVFRMGGDEFAIIMPYAYYDEAEQIVKRILQSLKEPVIVKGNELHASTSIGISIYPENGSHPHALMRSADVAMYLAKEAGKGNYKFFSESHRNKPYNRLQLENHLRKALEYQELFILYQPKVNLQNNEVVGVEALLRWNHPEWGAISPAEFIAIAEETGLIIPIGDWVLRKACIQNQLWQETGLKPISISVNISLRQLFDPDFAQRVSDIVLETNMETQWLEFEITESIMMRDVDSTLRALNQFREMGIMLSVDDFGTGYSSLNYIRQFPLNTLKIDGSFIKEISEDSNDNAIIASIISMAKHLKLSVVAEGVEKESQVNYLQRQGCDTYQGYLFSPPVSPEHIEELLRAEMTA